MNFKKSTNAILVCIFLLFAAATVQATISVKIFSRDDGLSETNASKPRIYIQNTGTESISNFYYNYYFETENGKVPVIGDYYTPYEDVTLVPDGGSKYHVKYTVNATIVPGQFLPDNLGNEIGLNYNTWDAWDKTNDYSNNNSSTFIENTHITVYVNGILVYGTGPSGSGGTVVPPNGTP